MENQLNRSAVKDNKGNRVDKTNEKTTRDEFHYQKAKNVIDSEPLAQVLYFDIVY